jgi:ElaB/YqjD/DUF883 family membrane-anchored ribosome-binding protein
VSSASDTVQQFTSAPSTLGSMIVETIRENPIPAALAGVGLGWLIVRMRDHAPSTGSAGTYPRRGYYGPRQYDAPEAYGRYDSQPPYGGYPSGTGYGFNNGSDRTTEYAYQPGTYQQPGSYGSSGPVDQAISTAQGAAQNMASQAQDTAQNIASQVQGTAQGVASQVGDTAGQVAGTAQYGAQQAVGGMQQMIEERPLAVAAVALGIGAAVGLALPQTPQENEWMGDARQSLMETAQQKAQETVLKVQAVAGDAMDAAQQSAQQQGLGK